MNLIFIDTNIYLRFFDSNSKEFEKLLEDLIIVKSNIFITEQIKVEIERNKLNVFKKSISNYLQNTEIKMVNLPNHIAGNNFEKIQEWNKKKREINKENKKLINELDGILDENLLNISTSKDNVSLKLKSIFQNILVASSNEKELARIRKEIGNPPGKKKDALGDQITWEQLLNKIPETNEIWIITNDFDFYTKYKKNCYLNPFLIQELLNKKIEIKINIFETLSDGLKHFFKSNNIQSKISNTDFKKVIEEEKTLMRSSVTSSNINSIGYDAKTEILEIEFNHGGVYQYFDVPESEHKALMNASSHGRYFSENIRNNYGYQKM